jgi:hypothetical protein
MNLPVELFIKIGEQLDLKTLVRTSEVNSFLSRSFRGVEWKHLIHLKKINELINYFKFSRFYIDCRLQKHQKIRLDHCRAIEFNDKAFVNDSHLEYLTEVEELIIRRHMLRGEGLKRLTKCRILSIGFSCGITDEAFEEMNNLLEVQMIQAENITSRTYMKFNNCVNINLLMCNSIQDSDLQYFKNCIRLSLSYCMNITDSGMKYLGHVKTLSIHGLNISSGLQYLTSCRVLGIQENHSINSNSMKFLENIESLIIHNCNRVKLNDFKLLKKCRSLDIHCEQLDLNQLFDFFSEMIILTIRPDHNFNFENLKKLKKCRRLTLVGLDEDNPLKYKNYLNDDCEIILYNCGE